MSLLSPQLIAFMAVVEYKTVHRAAEAINLTQTAVTSRLRNLEARLKTSLFTRTRRGMELTPEGEALMHYCLAATDLEGEALARIKGSASETDIKLCITGPSSMMRARIIPQCLKVLENHPRLFMHFDINDSEDRDNALKSGKAQMAILQKHSTAVEMQTKALKPEQYVLVCTSNWKKRPIKSILQKETIIDFDPSDTSTYDYLKLYEIAEFARPERHFVNRTETLAMMICQGLGYGVLTKEFSAPYVRRGEMMTLNNAKSMIIDWNLAWYHRPEPPKYFADLVGAIN